MKKEVLFINDREFIKYLCKEIWYIVSDGDDPDIEFIKKQLLERGINPDDVFVY